MSGSRLGFVLVLLVASQAPLLPQIGRYPGGYPPGQYPGSDGGPGSPFPWPRRGKQGGNSGNTPTDILTRTAGKLQKIDKKSIVIEAADGRVLEFRRTEKTKFYKESQEIGATDLNPGDEISVEATQDQQGYLHARNVYFQRSANTAGQAESHNSTSFPTPARDEDDPGPPVLRRGIPPERPASKIEDTASSSAAPVQGSTPSVDPLIQKAREAAGSFSDKLPNYICKEYMARFASTSHPVDWEALDVVSTDIVYEDGRERYRDVAINGKLTHKQIEELSGSWSTGEFATVLRDLLSPTSAADFRLRSESNAAGMKARIYDFEVQQANSHWHVQVASQSMNPGYKGSVWIEPDSGRVLRIEMQARSLPEEFPLDTVETAVDYENVRIAGGQFLLPVHAENLSCQRGTSDCSLSKIDFRNYHKYEAESSVAFGGSKVAPKPSKFSSRFGTDSGRHTLNKSETRPGPG
jgi:hypothetical protein